MRTVKEWIGKTDDSVPPPTVRLRILLDSDRKCYLSGQTIRPGDEWHLEHVKPIWAGGENRESNLKPALVEPHREKSKREAAEKAKADAMAKAAYGIEPESKRRLSGQGFRKSEPQRRASRPLSKTTNCFR